MQKSQTPWSVTSPSFLVAAALAAFMLFLGVRGLLAPEAAAHGFGFPVVDPADAVWLRIKGDRDLNAGLGIVVFLALRWRRALGALLLASIASPLLDCIISLSTPGHNTAFALSIHGGATALVAVLGAVLFRRHAGSTIDTTDSTSSTAASATD
ncbi:MAG: DUF4267 domain-containing protein [Pseudomonadota bacterium]